VQRVHFPASVPCLLTFRPQCFAHSRRLSPLCTLWACFIPLPRPGFAFQGLSPLPSRAASSTTRPLLALATFPSSQVALTVQFQSPALQGLDPDNDPSRQTGGLVLLTVRSPLKFSLPRAFLQLPWGSLHTPSTHDLSCQTLRVTLAAGLRRINRQLT
jgi:hypothetical protein